MSLSPELLAPAGCYPSLQAAIDGGADAVYFGLAQLNMRARARRSFKGSDLAEIMKRLHDNESIGNISTLFPPSTTYACTSNPTGNKNSAQT